MIIKNPLIIKKAKLQVKTATPTTSSQTITADSGYDGLSEVDIQAVNSSIDSNIQAENIKKDVTILGVTGTLESGGGISKLSQVIDGSITELTAEDFGDATTLGFGCLGGLTNLTELIVPENITYINKFAFFSIPNATSLHFNAINASNDYAALQYGSLGNGYFCIVGTGMGIKGKPITVYIGNNVTQIPKYQFASSSDSSGSRFTNLIFDDNSVCTTLNSGCFSGSALTTVTIPSSVTTINSYAFSYCKKLTTVNFDSGSRLTSMKQYTFASCTSLTSITIPASVTSIEKYTFSGCSSLTEMTILATTPPTLSSSSGLSSSITFYIPAGTLSAYQTATNWSSFADKFVELSE